jgi:hypothetical protein
MGEKGTTSHQTLDPAKNDVDTTETGDIDVELGRGRGCGIGGGETRGKHVRDEAAGPQGHLYCHVLFF